jgi:hypothetical protein
VSTIRIACGRGQIDNVREIVSADEIEMEIFVEKGPGQTEHFVANQIAKRVACKWLLRR